jgi:hypothetical protein
LIFIEFYAIIGIDYQNEVHNNMHRSRGTGKFIFSISMMLALYFSILISRENYTTIFIAFSTLVWHAVANLFCGMLASYRFKNPTAKYIEIKNKIIRKLFVHPYSFSRCVFIDSADQRTNLIGLILNITNVLTFVSFELLLLLPKIPCDSYIYELVFPKHGHGGRTRSIDIELNSLNEVIPAEASRAFASVTVLIVVIFLILSIPKKKKNQKRKTKNKIGATKRTLEAFELHHQLYTSLVDIAVRANNKKHKFWYKPDQLDKIEGLVRSATENIELKLERKSNKLVSFEVIDKQSGRLVFTGLFI